MKVFDNELNSLFANDATQVFSFILYQSFKDFIYFT